MNKDKFEGKWREFKGKIKEKWGKLTDNDMMQINGRYDQFLGALQNRYGYEKDRAEKEFSNWNWGEESTGVKHQNMNEGSNREQTKPGSEGFGKRHDIHGAPNRGQIENKDMGPHDKNDNNRNKKRKAG